MKQVIKISIVFIINSYENDKTGFCGKRIQRMEYINNGLSEILYSHGASYKVVTDHYCKHNNIDYNQYWKLSKINEG
jgi:hypothetical protein